MKLNSHFLSVYLHGTRTADRTRARALALSLALVLLVAAVLRINHIKQPLIDAYSWRQASTAMIADNYYHTNWNILYPEVNWTGPGPNYQGREFQTVSYTAALLYLFFGQHDRIGRGVAIVFGLWGIFALYQLVRRVWDEERALLSAAVMAVLPGSIFVDRSFLPDPAMVALVVTSFWMLVAYLQTERWRYLILGGLIGAWGFATKVPGVIVGLPMLYSVVVIVGFRQILRPAKLAALLVFGFLALGPVLAYYLWARHLALAYPPYHFAGDGNWVWQQGLGQWLDQQYFLPRLRQRFVDWLWTPPIIGLVVSGALFRPAAKCDPATTPDQSSARLIARAPWVFHWWMLGGIILYAIGARELVDNPWNFHIIDPAAAALAANAIYLIVSSAKKIPWRLSGLIAALLVLSLIGAVGQRGLNGLYRPYASDSMDLGLALRSITKPGDLVTTIANAYGDPVAIYYSKRRGWVFPPAQPPIAWNQLPADDRESIRLLSDLRAQGARWLGIVKAHQDEIWKEHALFGAYIDSTCELKAQSPDWVIYRILSPAELSRRSARP